MLEIKVIGIGGVGCGLLPFLARYLNYQGEPARITLIDGDEFERANADRQAFGTLGNKAKVKATEMAREFQRVAFRAVPQYISEANITEHVQEGDTVFLGVDNHKTRKVVSDYCEKLMARGSPQLLFANLAIASAMLNAFYGIREGKLTYGEVYLDILEGKSNPVRREGKQ